MITTPGSGDIGYGGIIIAAPPGTVIDKDGTVSFPKGSGGATITHGNGHTFSIHEDATIILDMDTPLGYFIGFVNPFEDVSATNWFYDYVMFAYAHGLMVGTSANPMRFSPNAELTRGMIVTILHRMQGSGVRDQGSGDESNENNIPNSTFLIPNFSDVVADAWYADAIKWAAENGIVGGYGDGRFGPNDNITREQLVTVLYNYCKWKGIDVSVGEDTNILSYNDAFDISEWAIPAFQWACGAGVIDGKPGALLDPHGSATRAEFAAILMRFIEAAY